MKLAVLLLMHKHGRQQKALIEHLAKDFDVYIHIDRRTAIDPETVRGPRVRVHKVFDVFWGSFNQIQATAYLMREANKVGYDRYMILSGEDVPLKSNAEILRFFEGDDREFLESFPLPHQGWGGEGGFERVDYFYPDSHKRGQVGKFRKRLHRILEGRNERFLIPLMRRFGWRRRLPIEYHGGANWMDLSRTCVTQIVEFLECNPGFLRKFRFTRCADEIIFQTILHNFLRDLRIEPRSLREIDWSSGPERPRIFRSEDLDRLSRSECLFARKFDETVDPEIIEAMYERLRAPDRVLLEAA